MKINVLSAAAATITLSGMLNVGCMGAIDPADALYTEQPIVLTGADPVVRIKSSSGKYCTATAIHDDLLLTSASCLKASGSSMSTYVQVVVAAGANAGAQGRYSSYYIMSQDLYSGSYSEFLLNKRDFALIRFSAGTFSSYFGTTNGSSSTTGQTVRVLSYGSGTLGYADRTVEEYLPDSPTNTTYGLFLFDASALGTTLNSSDGGAPVLLSDSSGYRIVGVVSEINGSDVRTSVLTSAVNGYAIALPINNLSSICSEAYKDINYSGEPFPLCNTDNENGMNPIFSGSTFSDPFKITEAWKYTDWNDTASSLKLPAGTILTLYQHIDGTGSTLTLQNAFPFGNPSSVVNLTAYDFNDRTSGYSAITTSTPGNYSFLLQLPVTGKCLDVDGGTSNNGTPLIEWACAKGNTNQLFRIEAVGSYYQIRNPATDNCLDLAGGGGDGTPMQLWDCVQNDNQLFTITSNTYTGDVRDFTIKNKGNGKCLDLTDGNSANGTRITVWPCNANNQNQNFVLKLF